MAVTVPYEKLSISKARDTLQQRYEDTLYQKISEAIKPNFGALISKDEGLKHRERERKKCARISRTVIRWFVACLEALRSRNTFNIETDHSPIKVISKTKPRSASRAARTAAADTDSGGGGPDDPDPDPDPDPERPYIALGIDHKATTPAGPPVLAVLRPFTDLNTVTAQVHNYAQIQYTEPQGSNSPPP